MTAEAAPGQTRIYTFPGLKPGTFLYQSGSHPAVQVQMGLYGAVTHDAAAGAAYTDVPYLNEVLLLYSEIDVALHQAIAGNTYGTANGPTSTINYYPELFLVNGESYANEAATPAIESGAAGQATLIRLLNAGLRTHVPVLDNGALTLVAEDGNPYPFARPQAAVLLAAGKTHDATWTPPEAGVYALYDRSLSLSAPGQGAAGMLARLRFSAAPGGSIADGAPRPSPVDDALDDARGRRSRGQRPRERQRCRERRARHQHRFRNPHPRGGRQLHVPAGTELLRRRLVHLSSRQRRRRGSRHGDHHRCAGRRCPDRPGPGRRRPGHGDGARDAGRKRRRRRRAHLLPHLAADERQAEHRRSAVERAHAAHRGRPEKQLGSRHADLRRDGDLRVERDHGR